MPGSVGHACCSFFEYEPHVAEEQHLAKSFDLAHGADRDSVGLGWPSEPKHRHEADVEDGYRVEESEGMPMGEAGGQEVLTSTAPSPPVEPEALRELSEVEKAMAFSFSKDRR